MAAVAELKTNLRPYAVAVGNVLAAVSIFSLVFMLAFI